MQFPIDAIESRLLKSLREGSKRFVLSAPTGSGKSTRLPVMFMNSGFANGKILVMQPRRVAARMLAKSVGRLFSMEREVGWHVRFDKHYNADTKIVFVTEGILARMLLADPSLRGVGAIVFDEFHERNIYADVSLALALKTARELRPDLIIAACSASMDTASLASFLNAETLESGGRLFPVETRYAPYKREENVWDIATREFEKLAREFDEGNFLIFMAGAYEISRTVSRIIASPASRGFDVFSLHGDLPAEKQDAILAPSIARKVIVSTNVAETSLTIEGVKFVIDSGQVKVSRYDSTRGVNTLLVERASLASATQRAGRAGRTSAGVAVRLWRQRDEEAFPRYNTPEILRLDLSQILLWLKGAGLDFSSLELFENPPQESVERAAKILRELGAFNLDGSLSPIGKIMADFPTQPRYARLIIEGARLGCLRQTCELTALADVGRIKLPLANRFAEEKRDNLVGEQNSEVEELLKLCALARENSYSENFCREIGIHASNARRLAINADELFSIARNRLDVGAKNNPTNFSKCVLSAFSDHLCVRLNQGTYAIRVAGGRGGEVRNSSRQWAKNVFVALDLSEQNVSGRVNIIASNLVPVDTSEIRQMFAADLVDESKTFFDERQKRVESRRILKFRDLILFDEAAGNPDPSESAKILRDEILAGRLLLKNFDEDAIAFVERVNFVAKYAPESGILAIDEAAKSEIFEQMCCGCRSYSDVKNLDVQSAFRDWLSSSQRALLKYLAPEFVEFPTRRKPVRIRYELSTGRAVVASLFKDFYDFDEKKIKICDGRILPTFEILAPNGRPVQTTQNLKEFFATSWAQIKKEMRARYPKHFKNEPRD